MEFVGRPVRKEFKGFGFFSGVVNSYDPSTGLFEIVYEDGDSEELEFSETASLLEGMGVVAKNNQSGADELMKQPPTRVGRKPKKRRRVEIGDSGNSSAYLTSDGCLKESGEEISRQDGGSEKGFLENLQKVGVVGEGLNETVSVNGSLNGSDGCNGIIRSNNGLNLNDELDLNVGLNLNDGLNLNEEFNLNVNCEEHLNKKSACIDLNLDANGDFEEDLKGGDSGVCIVGTQKKELCFDLNLGLDEEIKNSEGQFIENSSSYIVEETQKQETGGGGVEGVQMEGHKKGREEVCCEINGGTHMDASCRYAENKVDDSCVGLVEEFQKCGSGGLKADDTPGATNANEFSTSEGKLKEGLVGTGTGTGMLLDHGDQGNSGITNKERNRRKRRKLPDNVNSDTETLLRRSSRRIAAADSSLGLAEEVQKENIVSGGLKGGEMHGAKGAKGFMHSEVQLEEGLPDAGTSLYHVYEGNSGSTCKEGNRRKRRKLSDNLNSPTETVLRRSSRRLAGTLSAQNHVSSGATSLADNEAQSSAAVSAVLEEKPSTSGCEESEEYSGLPSKLQLPPSSENLNLDGIPVLDLFSVYACLRSFSALLFLSPFELEDFVAALKSEVPTLLFDCIHVSLLQTLRKHLEFLSNENSLSASNCLRNLNWDLLDLITWPMFLVEYLLMHGSKLKPGFDLCKLKLFEYDYYKQPAPVKIEILRCLCDDVIEVEAIRSEVNRRMLAAELNMDTDRTMRTETSKRRRTLMDVSGGSCLTEEVVDETTDWNSDECCLCKMDGSLICCDGCPAAYHFRCVGITSSLLPEGDWYCPECVIDKDKPWLKLGKSLRGAELLGVDPYGRIYYSSCGYLLVSDSCDNESLYHYYQRNDLTYVVEVFKSSDILYNPIFGAILRHWNIPVNSIGAKGDVDFHNPTVHSILLKGQMPTTTVLPLYLAPSESCLRDEIINERKPEENSVAVQYSGNTDCEVSALVNNNPMNLSNVVKIENLLTSSEGSAETSQATGIQKFPKTGLDGFTRSTGILNDSESQGKILSVGDSSLTSSNLDGKQVKNIQSADCCHMSSMMETRNSETPQVQLGTGYMNYYSFARTASLVAEELTRKSSDKITENTIKSVEDIILAQLKAISKKSSRFSWPNIQKLTADSRKEKCGWCFFCKAPDEDRDCFFNMNDSSLEGFTSDVVGLCSKQIKKGHLVDVICYILCIEDRLHGFLLGPWLNPHFTKIWHKSVVKASDIASLKHLLLLLESNLRPLALSAEWTKHVDSVAAMGSASHIVTSSFRVSSKNGIGRKRARSSDLKPNPSSNAAAGLGLFWWRGGRLSRELFSCKALPRSLASKAARTAGCTKVPGILYPDSSEFAKRSKYVAWRAAVAASRSVEQLALQVRELDANIRWDEIENTNLLSKMDQFRKSVRPFKKVIIRRKSIEGTVVKYLLDFGKRRIIPDIVVTHGSVVEESSSGRKKYWLEESHVPLYLLKTFEEKRIARKSSKMSPAKLHESVRIIRKNSKEKGFAYLFAKAERSEYYQCGHCNKDVLIREAVGCQHCKGFFHKRHVRKSAGAITAECTYTCHKCHSGNFVKLETKKGKSQSQKSKKGSTVSRILRSKITKKACKDKKPAQKQNSKKDVVALPLRRSARNVKCIVLPNKKVGRRKRGKGKGKGKAKGKGKQIRSGKEMSLKPKNGTWQKKRTLRYHTSWVNGLLLSRKPNDERVMHFRSEKLVTPEQLIVFNDQPKCSLCCEQEFTSELNYVGCECCGEWFHGDAFGLRVENIGNLIGFRCHKCRNRTSPVCPHFCRKTSDETEMCNLNDEAGIECAEEVSDTVVAHSTEVPVEKFHTNEQSRNLTLDDVSGHEDKEPGTPSNLNQVNAEVSNNVVLSTKVLEEHEFHTDEESKNLPLHDESSCKDQEAETVPYLNQVKAVIERVEEVCNTIALLTEVPKNHKLFLHTNDLSFDDESNHKDQELGTDPSLNQVIAGMECAEQVSTEVMEEHKIHTDGESKSQCLDDESIHKDKEVETLPNLNQANAENGYVLVSDGQKKEAIQISNDNWRADLSMESNEDVSFAEDTIVVGTGQNGAIVTSVETEFPSSKSDVDVMEMASLHQGE